MNREIKELEKIKNKRLKEIDKSSSINTYQESNINRLAKTIHPEFQNVIISDIINENRDCKTFVLQSKDKNKLAPFKAGQYINIYIEIDNKKVTRPYNISSSPKMAKEGIYHVTIKAMEEGLVSNYLLGTLKIGDELVISSPKGILTYDPLRDERHIVALAGGVGITPFFSLAQAIIDGDEDCLLTIFYGAPKERDLLFTEQFDDIVSKTNKVKIIYVLNKEKNAKYEKGLITKKLIDKYIDSNVTFYLSGPEEMYKHLSKELSSYNLPNKFFRYEQPVIKPSKEKGECRIRVKINTNEILIKALKSETIMTSLTKANLNIPSSCHNGTCGLCKTKLISGEVIMSNDFRKKADKEFNYIHPCITYPASDLVIEIDTIL